MCTVNATNFFEFGVNEGDTQMPMIDDGNSMAILLPTPFRFYESHQHTLFVSQLCIFSYIYTGCYEQQFSN